MATHTFNAADATIVDPIYIVLNGAVLATRNLAVFTGSDLSDFCPLAIDSRKGIYNAGRCFFDNSTYQPKFTDGPKDGKGFLALTVVNVANAGWYQFFRLLPDTLWVGNNTDQSANGLYLDFDFEFDTIGQAHRIGCINPHHFNNANAVPSSLSLHNTQYDLRGIEEDNTAANSVNVGAGLAINTHYWARETFGTNSIVLQIYPTENDRTNDTNVIRTCTCSNIDVMRVQAVGAFVRYNTAGSILKIYNFGGTICDWFGQNKTATFNAVDLGASGAYLDLSSATGTTTGNTKIAIRVQVVDGVWSNYWCGATIAELAGKIYRTKIYAFQIKLIFNECDGANEATFTTFSIDTMSGDPIDFPDQVNVLDTDTVNYLPGRWTPATASKYKNGETYGVDGTSETGTFTGSSNDPTTPTVVAEDAGTGSGVKITATGADAGTTQIIFYRLSNTTNNSNDWTQASQTISGNGNTTVTGLTEWQYYEFYIISCNGVYPAGLKSLPAFTGAVRVTDGSEKESISQYRVIEDTSLPGSERKTFKLKKLDKPISPN